jgi:hypothetical protein
MVVFASCYLLPTTLPTVLPTPVGSILNTVTCRNVLLPALPTLPTEGRA